MIDPIGLSHEHAAHAWRARAKGWHEVAGLHQYLSERYARIWPSDAHPSVRAVYERVHGARAVEAWTMDAEELALERAGYVLSAGCWIGSGPVDYPRPFRFCVVEVNRARDRAQ